MIDNFEKIKTLLKFNNENEFYFLQIIQRKKDTKDLDIKLKGFNNNNRLIKAYYIYSIEQLDKYKDEIIQLCKLFNVRAGINLNVRNSYNLSLDMISLLACNIKSGHYNQLSKLYNNICGLYSSDKNKKWIVDFDTTDLMFIDNVATYIEDGCDPILTDKVISIIPSKSGYHLITKPFNSEKFKISYPNIDIHKDNPTNLYIPDNE